MPMYESILYLYTITRTWNYDDRTEHFGLPNNSLASYEDRLELPPVSDNVS